MTTAAELFRDGSAAHTSDGSRESGQPPKLLDEVQILTLVLTADVARLRKASAL